MCGSAADIGRCRVEGVAFDFEIGSTWCHEGLAIICEISIKELSSKGSVLLSGHWASEPAGTKFVVSITAVLDAGQAGGVRGSTSGRGCPRSSRGNLLVISGY